MRLKLLYMMDRFIASMALKAGKLSGYLLKKSTMLMRLWLPVQEITLDVSAFCSKMFIKELKKQQDNHK